MSVGKVLVESFGMLLDEPRVFLPKLLSTFLSSGFLVLIGLEKAGIRSLIRSDPLLFVSGFTFATFLIGIVGVFASLMVASMVKNRDEEKMLAKSFREVLGRWKNTVLTAFIFLLLGFVIAVPMVLGIALSGSNILFLVYGGLVSLLILLAVSFYSYFLPITLVENSFMEGLLDSAKSSQQNSKEVALLTLFSLTLFLFAFGVASRPELEALGYVGFLAGRLVSAVVNTYLFVVSPAYYLEK